MMTFEEANAFLDNLKVCVEEHPIVADWLIEIANRNLSEKPNNCKDCFLCKWLGNVDVCGRCRNRNLFAEAEKTEPQTDELQCDEREEDEYCNGCRFWYEPQVVGLYGLYVDERSRR